MKKTSRIIITSTIGTSVIAGAPCAGAAMRISRRHLRRSLPRRALDQHQLGPPRFRSAARRGRSAPTEARPRPPPGSPRSARRRWSAAPARCRRPAPRHWPSPRPPPASGTSWIIPSDGAEQAQQRRDHRDQFQQPDAMRHRAPSPRCRGACSSASSSGPCSPSAQRFHRDAGIRSAGARPAPDAASATSRRPCCQSASACSRRAGPAVTTRVRGSSRRSGPARTATAPAAAR